MNDPKLSIQLYSLRRETTQDPETTVRAVPGMGFDGVELAGRYGWDAGKWQGILADTGLKVVGAHVGLGDLEKDLDGEIAFARAIGCSRLIVPAIGNELRGSKAAYAEAALRINGIAARLQDEGLRCLYHNHAFEFEALPEGGYGMDVLFAETDPGLVQFELDTYWLEKGGQEAFQYVTDHAARVGMIHAKELRRADGADVAAGVGDIDFKQIIPLAAKSSWPVVVEFEGENAMEIVAKSAAYLNALE